MDSVSVGEFVSKVENSLPDHVIFESVTPSFEKDVQIAEEIKKKINCKIIFFGPHTSALPVETMEDNCLDAVIVGECELSLAEYIEKGPINTKGVCYRDQNNKVVLNPPREYIRNLDMLPFPARDLIPNYEYFDPILKNPFTFVLAGRGCPYSCTFCNWPQIMTGRTYRGRSPKNVVDELEFIEQEYSFQSFLFNDDTFTVDKGYATAICDEIINRGIKIPWACYSRADNTDIELHKILKKAGCFLIKVGVESGNQAILDKAKKHYKIDKVVEGIKSMRDSGLNVHSTFIFGLPGETKETIDKSIEFAQRLNSTTVQFSTVIPYPGTTLYEYLKEQDYLLTKNWEEYLPMYPIFEYPNLSAKEMGHAVKKAYRKYYFRPGYLKTGTKQLFSRPGTVISNIIKLVKFSFLEG